MNTKLKSYQETTFGPSIGIEAVGTLQAIKEFQEDYLKSYPVKDYRTWANLTPVELPNGSWYKLAIIRSRDPKEKK